MSDTRTKDQPEVDSGALLGLGLIVVETRHRRADKNLGPWKPRAAFVDDDDAQEFWEQYHSVGDARIVRPNREKVGGKSF